MKLRKITFNIQLVGGKKQETSGYLFEIDGLPSHYVAHRSKNNPKNWLVSEYLTGTVASPHWCSHTTRKGAISETINQLQGKADIMARLIGEHNHVNEPIKEAIK